MNLYYHYLNEAIRVKMLAHGVPCQTARNHCPIGLENLL